MHSLSSSLLKGRNPSAPPRTPPPHTHGPLHSLSRRAVCALAAASSTSSAAASTTVVERRAADVVVLGDSCTALAAAFSLSRRGKKVVWLPDLGLSGPQVASEAHRPLLLTHPDPAMVSLSAEAAAYWRGLQAQSAGSGLLLLRDCRSVDLAAVRGGGEAGELLGRLQDAAKAAGIRLGSLRPDDLGALFPALRLGGGVTGLLQPEGGVLNSSAARSLLLSLGERQGVMVRERLVLRGWRDAGSHFVVRASSAVLPGVLSYFEAEQLLVAPSPREWPRHVIRMFGADADLRVTPSSFLRCAAAADLSALPLWRSIGPVAAAGVAAGGSEGTASFSPSSHRQQPEPRQRTDPGGGPSAARVVVGFPARLASPGSSSAACKLALGAVPRGALGAVPGGDPWSWRLGPPDRIALTEAHRAAEQLLRGLGPVFGEEPPSTAPPAPLGELALHVATPDGWPALGSLPGVEPGRLLFATTSSCSSLEQSSGTPPGGTPSGDSGRPLGRTTGAPGPSPLSASASLTRGTPAREGAGGGGQSAGAQPVRGDAADASAAAGPAGTWAGRPRLLSDGYQLSPLLAKMAVDLLCGAARPQEADPERLGLGRAALGLRARWGGGLDPWDGLGRWQSGEAFQAEAEAEAGVDTEEARERAEAVARGAKMVGGDAGAGGEEAERRRGSGPRVFL